MHHCCAPLRHFVLHTMLSSINCVTRGHSYCPKRLALLRHLLPPCPCTCDGPPFALMQREDIERLFSEVTDKWGTVNVLVNNAVSSWRQH